MPSRPCILSISVLMILILAVVFAPSAFASGPYEIGSANTVSADPNVPRPSTTPCVVQLFSNAEFDNFNPFTFSFAPPSDCPGPWAKVVLTADINVTAGIQYDRTANFWLGPTNIYFGTTSEPSPTLGPSWHLESDLTEYSSIFTTAQSGQADIGNTLCCGLSGIIFASASLEFYPLAHGQAPPPAADIVLALSGGASGGTVGLGSTSSQLSGTFTLPLNIQKAYLDVYSQSQSSDEFWYTCVPNDVSAELFSCGNTGFRESEVSIDGQPAGVAPVFPWIFTGGIDPFLWFPIPGVQTLNFIPYRVDLTPFAGVLSDGQPHTVSLNVYNANNYFSATASLLLYLDPSSSQTTGSVTQNTLAAPSPTVTENLTTTSSQISGTVDVSSGRSFVISGYVRTSHGKVTTTVRQTVDFDNNQTFLINATQYVQDISQRTRVASQTTVRRDDRPSIVTYQNFDFPLTVNITQNTLASGNIDQITTADQEYHVDVNTMHRDRPVYSSSFRNKAQHTDTLELTPSFNLVGNSGQSSAQQYRYSDSTGAEYHCNLAAANNVLTQVSEGCTGKGDDSRH